VSFIGDLERLFATSLYPLRVPLAVGLALAVLGLAVLARRRGWFAAARRHPGRSAALGIVALAIGVPVAWYLGSPLFIRTELFEPPPAGAIGSALPNTSATPGTDDTPGPASTVVSSGSFQGADEFHFGQGVASIVETGTGRFTLRFDDFSVRNGPDLYVYLSPDAGGYAEGAVELGTLKATDGAFGYELPAGLDPFDFASAVIWCKQFAVLFAVAPLAPA